jgi:hypothetical protein
MEKDKSKCNPKYLYLQLGFGLLDSLIALTLLGVVLGSLFITANNIANNKEAKKLADQTILFAKIFTAYMNNPDVYQDIQKKATATTPFYISPKKMDESEYNYKWNDDIAKTNIYGQTPCVAVLKNSVDANNLDAILFYVNTNGASTINTARIKIIDKASIYLGGKGGAVVNYRSHYGSNGTTMIQGNGGWSIDSTSPFLFDVSQCGGRFGDKFLVADNSLAINLDMMPEWNQDLQPNLGLIQVADTGSSLSHLPGHTNNANTATTNIYMASGRGIILDNADSQNPIKLKVEDGSVIKDAGDTNTTTSPISNPMLNFGNDSVTDATTIIADTIRPTQNYIAGSPCLVSELGKVVVDRGDVREDLQAVLARNTLICSHNSILCKSPNISETNCYLPTSPNTVTYKNITNGVQDKMGEFYCPVAIPFATSVTTSSSRTIGLNIEVDYYTGHIATNSTNQIIRQSSFYGQVIKNVLVVSPAVAVDPIYGEINNYKMTLGYRVKDEENDGGKEQSKSKQGLGGNVVDIADLCNKVGALVFGVGGWTSLMPSTYHFTPENTETTDTPNFLCAFGKANGIAGVSLPSSKLSTSLPLPIAESVVYGWVKFIPVVLSGSITSVTCSNMPVYNSAL